MNPEPAYATAAPAEIDAVAETDAISRRSGTCVPRSGPSSCCTTSMSGRSPRLPASLGIPEGTAKSRLHAARQALQLAIKVES